MPVTSTYAASWGFLFVLFYFYFNEGFIISSGKINAFVDRMPLCHQAVQC